MMSRSSLGNGCSLLVVFVVALVSLPAGAQSRLKIPAAQKSEAPASIPRPTVQQMVVGLSSPVYVTNAHDGSNRLFILEQAGRIKVVQPGSTSPTLFLNITTRVLSGGERGLLGLAFHPQYSTNRRFFVYYTRQTDGAITVAEYHASPADPNVADTAETVILTIPHPNFANHNGGMTEFGPDGFLYLGIGDGGSGNDPSNNAQNIDVLLGKILRIDVDHPNGSIPYSSPASNPFFGATPGADEVFAYGMRNPWRFSFDRGTGQLYVGDVGQDAWEEIDIVTNGGNYGWRVMEGNHCNPNINNGVCTPIGIPPIAEYGHSAGRCSIIGGYVYRGTLSTLTPGTYIYGDLCTGEIFKLAGGVQSVLFDTNFTISSFGEDEAGEIYVVELGSSIYRIGTGPGVDTPGLYDPSNAAFFLRNSNSVGTADTAFPYGPSGAGLIPIVGDWNGDGIDTIGLYDPANAAFFLRNSNSGGNAEITFNFGPAGMGLIPIVGDWNGDGIDTVGLYDPVNSAFFLRNSNSAGVADITFSYGPGNMGLQPITGDWNGDGITTIGLYSPTQGSFFLRNSNSVGVADITFKYGPAGMGFIPLVGDWNNDGIDTIGLYDPSHAGFFLRNSNTSGIADVTFTYGPSMVGFTPLVSDWNGL
ncbi:MAG TPA: PQQ-dependent sugar dehydrogenase [Blastocatellia bacterium]|nr:PQQ-dependent sugar dehydrogenase [Blastocatellia bacterium]